MNRVGIWGSRILMCIILLILIVISFTGELVAFNDGKGWDGEIYYNIIENFDNLIINNGIDAYHMNRFFPFAIVHYILKLLNIPITVDSAIAVARYLMVYIYCSPYCISLVFPN